MTYTNNLPSSPVLRKYLSIDQTLHWADPLQQGMSFTLYAGPIPTAPHLHGGEVHSTSDGGPNAWFTNNGLHGTAYSGLASNPLGLPAGDQEVELVIQDRQFDTNGQLLFSDSTANQSLVDGAPSNPDIHPYWIPEFFGDTMLVNGRTWPYLAVEPRRYRFRFLNGSNARFLRMGLVDASSGSTGPARQNEGCSLPTAPAFHSRRPASSR